MFRPIPWCARVAATFSLVAISACGGGGGGGSAQPPPPPPIVKAPDAPVVSIALATKQLRFTWPTVAGATSYRLMQNPDGGALYTQAGDILAANATSATLEVGVHLVNWLNARYRVEACNTAGCTTSTDVSSISGFESATGYVKASDTGTLDRFGAAVAVSRDGSTLAVGSYLNDGPGDATSNSGAVYVYVRDAAGTWSQQAYVTAGNADADDHFGRSVDLSADGSTLLVGAIGEASFTTGVNGNSQDNTMANAGAAYVFVRNGASWTQQAYLKASNTQVNDDFGRDVAISDDGNIASVGAPGEDGSVNGVNGLDNNLAPSAGAVYVFTRSAGAWAQEAYIKASNSGSSQYFGYDIDMDTNGLRLVVGAQGEGSGATGVNGPQSNNNRPNSGAAYVFVRDNGAWSQEAYLKASRATSDILFGWRVAISGNGATIAIGAPFEDGGTNGVEGDQDLLSQANSGAVYLFTRSGNVWAQQAYVKASNTGANDLFGCVVALSSNGSQMVIGAQGEDSLTAGINGNQLDDSGVDVGAAYVFVRTNGLWAQQNYLKPAHPVNNQQFGMAIGMSGPLGTTLAVGLLDSSAATGIGGNFNDESAPLAGAVMLY